MGWASTHVSYRKKMADDEQIEMISDRDSPDNQQLENDGTSIVDGVYDIVKLSKEYVVAKCTFENESCLLIHHENLYSHPPFGITSRCRISISGSEYTVNILMREVERGTLESLDAVPVLLEKYSRVYKLCPGLDPSEYQTSIGLI